jgi:hypothetical protein
MVKRSCRFHAAAAESLRGSCRVMVMTRMMNTLPSSSLHWYLQQDIAAGLCKDVKPRDLWMQKQVYQEFPLDKFRGHLYQEKRPEFSSYWLAINSKKKKKRGMLTRKKVNDE